MADKTSTFLKGISVTTLFTIVGGIIGLIYFSTMSRLLSKEDFGYFAVLTGIMSVVSAFADAGLGAAIVQKKNADQKFISTAFTLSFSLGLICFILIYTLAPWLALLVADDYITTPLRIMSITLIFHSFTSVANAQLYRALKFKRIGIIGFVSNVVNTSLSVILAIKGFGLYAMISYVTFGTVFTTILLYTTSVKLPKLTIEKDYVKGIFTFGSWLTASVICNKVSTYIDRLVLPKLTSVETLGAYTRPASFSSNITGTITDIMDRVLFPMLSDIQDDRTTAVKVFYRAVALLNSFSVILGCLFFFNADLIIQVFFGEEWLELTPVLQVVSLTSVFFIDTQLVDCFFRSLNYVKTGFYIRLFALFWNLICIYVGAKYDVMGIAISLAFANISVIVLKMVVLCQKIDADWRLMFSKWIRAWKSAIPLVIIGLVFQIVFPTPTIIHTICFAASFVLVVIIEFLFFPKFIGNEYINTIYPTIQKLSGKVLK